ncbi:alpha/beta fold hydrolase [Geobacter sp. SVR]|uniref:alpha/beta fold hydrolase n=1 Tax=Geobacter sp. SVR TaxID=2495594 RepID=UPI00143EF581|nr:alpha/beta hydrolase [Geobacter sp. SVR]BCS55242.1 alpha/beta hydrolase [Geobacter sp. SVR]GCF86041.1 alpha/beta hydrolase [Geobacter sp. SVR]
MPEQPPMHDRGFATFTHSAGDVIRYRTVGCGPQTLLFLHGFAASMHTWYDLLPFFPPERFTLYLLDLKGHGGSSRPFSGDYSPLHNAELVRAFIRSAPLKKITLVGHSLGGGVALLAALSSPDVERLILIGAPAYPQQIPHFMVRLSWPVIGPLAMTLLPSQMIARLGLQAAFYRHERITRQLMARYAACYTGFKSACALARTVRHIVPANFTELIARYREITMPVLLLWGEHDRVVPLWQGERLQRELPDARLDVIPDCGHNPHEERPEATFACIAAFFDSTDVDKVQERDR